MYSISVTVEHIGKGTYTLPSLDRKAAIEEFCKEFDTSLEKFKTPPIVRMESSSNDGDNANKDNDSPDGKTSRSTKRKGKNSRV